MEQYIGQILAVGFNFAPVGWYMCDGSLVSISQNVALFSLLGTFYGGNGTTDFALPDLRGRTIVGQGQGPGLSNYVIGQMGGVESATLAVGNMPAHNHALMAENGPGTSSEPETRFLGIPRDVDLYTPYTHAPVALQGTSIGTTGGSQPFSVLNPYTTLNYIIAYVGVYPARS